MRERRHQPPADAVVAGRYLRHDQAEDRSLVLMAFQMRYWIVEEEDGLYALLVAPADAGRATRELAAYEVEREEERQQLARQWAAEPPLHARRRGLASLLIYLWVLAGFFLIQLYGPNGWVERGTADSGLILKGEWWRAVTALTLHGDLGHLLANAAVGTLFAAALLPWLGVGWTWFGFLLSGTVGNLINAWGFRGEAHRSIGASTAVFGGLGLLIGWQVAALLAHHASHGERPPWRRLFIPFAAGLALLAYLGVGDEHSRVDVTAHLFGMGCGIGFGLLFGLLRLPERTPPAAQRALALAVIGILCAAWALAW